MSMFIDTFTDRAMLCMSTHKLCCGLDFVALLLCRDELYVPYVLLLFICMLAAGGCFVRPTPRPLFFGGTYRIPIPYNIRCFVKRRGAAHD